MVQRLGLQASTEGGTGFIPGWDPACHVIQAKNNLKKSLKKKHKCNNRRKIQGHELAIYKRSEMRVTRTQLIKLKNVPPPPGRLEPLLSAGVREVGKKGNSF